MSAPSRGGGGGGDQSLTILYACKARTEIQIAIDYFSSKFCFLADEVLRKVASNYFSLPGFHLFAAASQLVQISPPSSSQWRVALF